MARIEKPRGYRVDIFKYDRGWGSKLDETIYFNNAAEAQQYCTDFNAQNTSRTVPDWYMVADYVGPV